MACFHSAARLDYPDAERHHDSREHSAVPVLRDAELRRDFREHLVARWELRDAGHTYGSLVHHGFLAG